MPHHSHSFASEEDLVQFWKDLGGTEGWQSHITPADLKAKLSTCHIQKANPAVKQGTWLHDVVILEEEEIAGYVSVILSRLPKLRKLRIYASSTWPFDWSMVPRGGFPSLEFVGLIRCPWTEARVSEMTDHLPTLKITSTVLSRGCGIGVYTSDGPTQDPKELAAIKKRFKKLDYLA